MNLKTLSQRLDAYNLWSIRCIRIMKTSILLLFISLFQLNATAVSAQDAVIKLKTGQMSVEQLLKEIEKQTDYLVIYRNKDIKTNREVLIQEQSGKVKSYLAEAFENTNITYQFDKKYILLTKDEKKAIAKPGIQQDEFKISGTIVDAKGETIIGANVIVKGTSNGTITDLDGKFLLNVPKDAILTVSYIGYSDQEIAVKGRTSLNIILKEDLQALDEVVVIGYGVVKKSDLTGSVSRVEAKELKNIPVSSIDKALQGRAAGVQISSVSGAPGSATSIRIRGGNSISANNEPLYVIDGFIGGGDLNSINPTDIESIEILKDAASTAIYGSRGANGVIMITTKKGKEGTNKINVNFYQGFQSLPRKLPFMEGPERAQYANDYADYLNTTRPFEDITKVTNTDWQDSVTQTASVTNADISISGGNKDLRHYISANYYNQEGVYKASGFTRYQTRINLDKKLFDFLKVGVQTNISNLHTDSPKFSYLNYIKEASTSSPIYDENGNYSYINKISGQTFENPIANINLIISVR